MQLFNGFFLAKGSWTIPEYILKDLPEQVWITVYMTLASTFFAVILGLPLGILLVAGDKNGVCPLPRPIMATVGFIVNILRSVPFVIMMVLVAPLSRLILGTSIGSVAVIVPLTIAAFPFVARLVEGSLREVDPNLIEAAQSMGASPFQIIMKVMIPESIPSLITNFTVSLTTILAYTAMAGTLGGEGLGTLAINYGHALNNHMIKLVCVVILVVLVQGLQFLGTYLSKKTDKRLK